MILTGHIWGHNSNLFHRLYYDFDEHNKYQHGHTKLYRACYATLHAACRKLNLPIDFNIKILTCCMHAGFPDTCTNQMCPSGQNRVVI